MLFSIKSVSFIRWSSVPTAVMRLSCHRLFSFYKRLDVTSSDNIKGLTGPIHMKDKTELNARILCISTIECCQPSDGRSVNALADPFQKKRCLTRDASGPGVHILPLMRSLFSTDGGDAAAYIQRLNSDIDWNARVRSDTVNSNASVCVRESAILLTRERERESSVPVCKRDAASVNGETSWTPPPVVHAQTHLTGETRFAVRKSRGLFDVRQNVTHLVSKVLIIDMLFLELFQYCYTLFNSKTKPCKSNCWKSIRPNHQEELVQRNDSRIWD